MLSSAALRKTASGWEFANEEALEDFVEVHLQSWLGLTVIKRQFTVNEQRCDIIAVDENKRLVVLELKNKDVKNVFIKMKIADRYPNILETIDELDKRACKFSSGQLIDLTLQKWLERL